MYKIDTQYNVCKLRRSFAIEIDDSFKSSISTIYQSFGGGYLYPHLKIKQCHYYILLSKIIALLTETRE